MARKRKKRPIKLTNKFEVFFFKYKYYIAGLLILNFLWNPNSVVSLQTSNSIILWSILSTIIIALIIVFFFIPTYRKVYTTDKVWGTALFFTLLLSLALKSTVLRINASLGQQKPIDMQGRVIKTCKSDYKGNSKYSATVNMGRYGKMNLRISEKSYKQMKKGSIFHQTWKKGSLGIMYWRREI